MEADHEFVVYGQTLGVVAECGNMAEAKRSFQRKLTEAHSFNLEPDLAIYRWQDGSWCPAISLYELQEWDLEKNPSRLIRLP